MLSRKANNATNIETVMKDNRAHYGGFSAIGMELIDNSAGDFEKYGIKNGHITVYIERVNTTTLHVSVRDNGTGIMDIDQALTIGERACAMTSINGHGQGFKNLPVSNAVLRTVNIKGEHFIVKGPFVENCLIDDVTPIDDIEHGTEFSFDISYAMLKNSTNRWGEDVGRGTIGKFEKLVQCVAEDIAFVHGRLMRRLGYTVAINAQDRTTNQEFTIDVQPMIPTLKPFDEFEDENLVAPKTEGKVVIPAFSRGKNPVTIEYEFGIMEKMDSIKNYFNWSMPGQGVYIYLNDRYIGKTSRLGSRSIHNRHNGMVGIINIVAENADDAPQTAIAKTGFVTEYEDYIRLMDEIYQMCPNIDQIMERALAKKVSEKTLCDLVVFNARKRGERIEREMTVVEEAPNDRVDIFNMTTKTLYEVKMKTASSDNVYQLKRYIDYFEYKFVNSSRKTRDVKRAVLTARDISPEAEFAMKLCNMNLKNSGIPIEIVFMPLHEAFAEEVKELNI